MVRENGCPFGSCLKNYLDQEYNSLTDSQKEHVRRYHRHATYRLGLKNAIFVFRRDPSKENQYVCVCGRTCTSFYSLKTHIVGTKCKAYDPESKRKTHDPESEPKEYIRAPCSRISDKAIEVARIKDVLDDDKKPINYYPVDSKPKVDDWQDQDCMEDVVEEPNQFDDNVDQESSQFDDVDEEHNTMADNHLTLFCLVDGDSTSNAFSVEIAPTKTVDSFKKLIKSEKAPLFDDVAADQLTLWRVCIPDDDEDDNDEIPLLEKITEKKKLKATTKLSKVFDTELPDETIHIIVQRPSPLHSDVLHPEVAALRKQLSQLQAEVQDSSITLGIVVKPEKKVAFSWSAMMETATLDDLKKNVFDLYPQYAHDDYLQIFVYNGQPKPELVRDDEDLRKILKVAKANSKLKLVISLETPTKNFSAWTFKDVCDEYNLSESSDPGLHVLPAFSEIQSMPLDSDLQRVTQDQLIHEIESRVDALNLFGANEATKSIVVASFMIAATRLFKEDLYLASQRNLSGRRGNGPLDFSVHPRKTHDYTLGVTEVKRDDFRQGVAQNIVQLESALTSKKRKRERYDVDGEEVPPMNQRAYGIVTDSAEWAFLECTLNEDETVTYRMSKLKEKLNFEDKWQEDAKSVFGKLVWLWTRMRDEIPSRDSYSRKLSFSPSNKRASV
ncbi:hypothetical protein BGZ47_011345 [Haplosporangium gracile]|nr:hypothetical protein BGZ47_011345 [Haplosporangium gracile]